MRPDNQQPIEQQPQAASDLLNASTREETYEAEFQAIIDRKREKSPRAENLKEIKECNIMSFTAFSFLPWTYYLLCFNTSSIIVSAAGSFTAGVVVLAVQCGPEVAAEKQFKQDTTTLTTQVPNGDKEKIVLPKHTSLAELHDLIETTYKQPMQIGSTHGITAYQPTESCCYTEKYPIEVADADAGADENPTVTLIYNDNIPPKSQRFFCCPCASSAAAVNETAPLLGTP
jgi:hypothetical protein